MEVILLLGAPGAGKSTLGRVLEKELRCQFFSGGDFIRSLGIQGDTELKTKAAAVALTSRLQGTGLLVLEYVKCIDDAYSMVKVLKECGATLVQAILVTDTERPMHPLLLRQLGIERGAQNWIWGHAEERKVAERLPKWRANVGRIVEYFSSMQVLTTFSNAEPMLHRVWRWNQPIRFIFNHKLEPLRAAVAYCLVTDHDQARRILQSAADSAGLLELCIPVPCASITAQIDVDWVSQPGRYTVSRKCDGTRYLLIVNAEGGVYFKNRVDFVYAFPLETDIPPNTILDGELVWHYADGGHFFVFDTLMVSGRRVWHLPLPQRLAELRWLSTATPPVRYMDGLQRQRRPSAEAKVRVILKQHHTVASFRAVAQCPFPNDGLIFTPVAMPYVTPVLLRKWQPCDQRSCDIQAQNGLVYECVHHGGKWSPVAIRWDKTKGQGNEEIGQPCKDPATFLHGIGHPLAFPVLSPLLPCTPPPIRVVLSKAECTEAVRAGFAERTLDAETGLEVFNNRKGTLLPCRGVVFDGECLLAAAFEPFESVSQEVAADHGQWISASFKFDGTLIVAFLHRGQVCTATRRRMDSEQAVWARARLIPEMLQKGWTYAFEAVYRDNTTVVPYPFEGLVFLHSWAPDGQGCAEFAHPSIMRAPTIVCRMRELDQLLRTSERGPPTFEGWVVRTRDGRRLKWVQEAYKAASRMIHSQLHPLVVWSEIRMGGTGGVDRRMPRHAAEEKRAMLKGLERAFDEELREWFDGVRVDFDAQRTWEDMSRHDWTEDFCMIPFLTIEDARSDMFKRRDCFCILSTLHPTLSLKANWAAFWDLDLGKFKMVYTKTPPPRIMRVQIMDRIRPAVNGAMLYYTPSPNFAQTFAKGWRDGVIKSLDRPSLLVQMLMDSLLEIVFNFLPTGALVRAVFVCKAWCALITCDQGLVGRAQREKSEEEEERFVVEYASPRSYGSDW
jgi:adenylate kinase family enzyme